MTATKLTTEAIEGGTYAVTFTFRDEEGQPVTPTGLTWTLKRGDGTVINNREDVAIASDSSITVVLSGSDLALDGYKDTGRRFLLVQGEYDSTLGSNLPIRDEVSFIIRNLVGG